MLSFLLCLTTSYALPGNRYNPLLKYTGAVSRWNRSSSFFGSVSARCGKYAIAGGKKSPSERPTRLISYTQNNIQALKRTQSQVRQIGHDFTPRSPKGVTLFEQSHDKRRYDKSWPKVQYIVTFGPV